MSSSACSGILGSRLTRSQKVLLEYPSSEFILKGLLRRPDGPRGEEGRPLVIEGLTKRPDSVPGEDFALCIGGAVIEAEAV